MTLQGVYTSQLFGWAFMAILVSWKVLETQVKKYGRLLINAITLLNLLIPPVFVQLNQVWGIPPGLDSMLISYFSRLFTR